MLGIMPTTKTRTNWSKGTAERAKRYGCEPKGMGMKQRMRLILAAWGVEARGRQPRRARPSGCDGDPHLLPVFVHVAHEALPDVGAVGLVNDLLDLPRHDNGHLDVAAAERQFSFRKLY